MDKTRLRIRFTKSGDLRWISHRDLARLWERLLRRAGLQLAFSQGFHPKPRINFPSALALGIEALDEIVELELVGEVPLAQIEEDIRRELPAGMELLQLESPAYSLGKARVLSASYRVAVPENELQRLQQRIGEILAQPEVTIDRDGKQIICPTNDPHFDLRLEGDQFVFSLPHQSQGSIRPSEILVLCELEALLTSGAIIQRTAVHLHEPVQPHT